jgi:hypothetical protein
MYVDHLVHGARPVLAASDKSRRERLGGVPPEEFPQGLVCHPP